MAANAAKVRAPAALNQPRPQDIDGRIGQRMRERRIMLGLTQTQLAELIGVTYRQAHKYETGVNRISAGRLHRIAQALGVGVDYFCAGLGGTRPAASTPKQGRMLELARDFTRLSRRQQEALCELARVLAGTGGGDEPEPEERPRAAA